jgi:hypothetical protein
MGETLLHTAEVVNGGDGAYTGATPTKDSTAQYNYTFTGWSKSVGGTVDADALENVIADRNVYAAFTSEIRSYTIRFYNGNTLLQTSTVPYGEMPVYTGAEPTPEVDYKFVGWTPNIEIVTGDVDYVARFVSTRSVARSIIDKSITEISNDEITVIGDYAFYMCNALTSIDLPNVTSIGKQAFYECSKLTSANIPNVTSLGGYAFSRCTKMTSIDVLNVTILGDNALENCTSLTSIDLPNVTSIGAYAFMYCSKLASIHLPKNPPTLAVSPFNSSLVTSFDQLNTNCVFYVPTGSLSLYESSSRWKKVMGTYSLVEEDR